MTAPTPPRRRSRTPLRVGLAVVVTLTAIAIIGTALRTGATGVTTSAAAAVTPPTPAPAMPTPTTTPDAAPPDAPVTSAAADRTWDNVAQCESSGNWATNTGNGFYGGLQFTASTWRSFGGAGMPQQASRDEQIAVGNRVLAAQGWQAWPVCSRKLGLR